MSPDPGPRIQASATPNPNAMKFTLDRAVIASGTTKTKVCKNFIDGEWVESVSDGLSKTATPRTRAKVGRARM